MEFVCNDTDNSKWQYDSVEKCYHRVGSNAQITKIGGAYLPDPFLLKENRKKAVRQMNPNINDSELDLLCSPQEATFKLWEHWKLNGN